MKKFTIVLWIVCSVSSAYAENNTTEELEKMSFQEYSKSYEKLNKIQKTHIQEKLAKIERVYKMAMEHNVTQMQVYKDTMYKAQRSIAMNTYLASQREKIVIRQDEIEAYYKNHIRDYTSVHAYTIVSEDKEALKPLLQLLAKSKNRLEAFKKLAIKHSKHPRAKKGGDLGFVGFRTMAAPFGAKAFMLKEGEYTQNPFKTTLGWHLVYVDEIRIAPLEKVKKNIAYTLRMEKYRAWFQKI